MNKTMIVAILIDYKIFNDKSLTMRINEGEGEYVANDVVIDSIDDYEYPYNHINREGL